jgi:hypothetical protein
MKDQNQPLVIGGIVRWPDERTDASAGLSLEEQEERLRCLNPTLGVPATPTLAEAYSDAAITARVKKLQEGR